MKTIISLILALALSACTGIPEGAGVIYTPDTVCLIGMTGEASEACFNTKTKRAFIKYADGRTVSLKAVGGGYAAGRLVIQLEDGGRVSVGRDGVVITEPPLPQ